MLLAGSQEIHFSYQSTHWYSCSTRSLKDDHLQVHITNKISEKESARDFFISIENKWIKMKAADKLALNAPPMLKSQLIYRH